jgi:hypothetical protein
MTATTSASVARKRILCVEDDVDIQDGLDAGAQAYLVKPDFENLKPTFDRLISGTDLTTHLSLP